MTAPTSELSQTIQQHLGWLKMYVEGMTSENWRDMRDRCSAQLVGLSQDLARVRGATPVADWRIVVNERVLLYVVHDNAQYEKDDGVRLSDWEGWCLGHWIEFNKGGWTWHGLAGVVTHVAPLPPPPSQSIRSGDGE